MTTSSFRSSCFANVVARALGCCRNAVVSLLCLSSVSFADYWPAQGWLIFEGYESYGAATQVCARTMDSPDYAIFTGATMQLELMNVGGWYPLVWTAGTHEPVYMAAAPLGGDPHEDFELIAGLRWTWTEPEGAPVAPPEQPDTTISNYWTSARVYSVTGTLAQIAALLSSESLSLSMQHGVSNAAGAIGAGFMNATVDDASSPSGSSRLGEILRDSRDNVKNIEDTFSTEMENTRDVWGDKADETKGAIDAAKTQAHADHGEMKDAVELAIQSYFVSGGKGVAQLVEEMGADTAMLRENVLANLSPMNTALFQVHEDTTALVAGMAIANDTLVQIESNTGRGADASEHLDETMQTEFGDLNQTIMNYMGGGTDYGGAGGDEEGKLTVKGDGPNEEVGVDFAVPENGEDVRMGPVNKLGSQPPDPFEELADVSTARSDALEKTAGATATWEESSPDPTDEQGFLEWMGEGHFVTFPTMGKNFLLHIPFELGANDLSFFIDWRNMEPYVGMFRVVMFGAAIWQAVLVGMWIIRSAIA